MVVEVFVPAGDGEESLGQECALGMCDEVGVAGVGNGGIECGGEAELSVRLAEEQNAGIGGDGAAGEVRFETTAFGGGEREGRLTTLCHCDSSGNGEDEVW